MNIRTLEFKNKSDGWEIQKMSFQQLNLLVGASGVGKTQILQAINTLKRFADGESFSGIQWNIEFTTKDGDEYRWEGEFEDNKFLLEYYNRDVNRPSSRILNEKIEKDKTIIAERTQEGITFNSLPTIKLPSERSLINMLKEEELISPLYEHLQKIILPDETGDHNKKAKRGIIAFDDIVDYNIASFDAVQSSSMSNQYKLYITYHIFNDVFQTIKQRFCEIFPEIEDIKIDRIKDHELNTPREFQDKVFIHIKHHNVEQWIPSVSMSSGMFRTFQLLYEIYLSADDSVILIDEFENSLGINCIRDITDDILTTDRNIQFIITSHHPYIINNVEFQYWKLLTRNGGTIKAHDISEYLSGKSHHENFMQLIQLKEYQTGLEEYQTGLEEVL
ncbi:MAG: AAA family ATPase [Candidatus Kapaibacterium sp.]